MTSSLKHRIDNRSIKEFTTQIKKAGVNEILAAYALVLHLTEKHRDASFKAFGNEDNNQVQAASDGRPDFNFSVNNKSYPVEIKVHSEKYRGIRIKKLNLQSYIASGAYVAIIQEGGYRILTPAQLKAISETPATIYPKFSPNDPCHYVSAELLNDCIRREWNDQAKEIIKLVFPTETHPAYEL